MPAPEGKSLDANAVAGRSLDQVRGERRYDLESRFMESETLRRRIDGDRFEVIAESLQTSCR